MRANQINNGRAHHDAIGDGRNGGSLVWRANAKANGNWQISLRFQLGNGRFYAGSGRLLQPGNACNRHIIEKA